MSNYPGDDLSPHMKETQSAIRIANALWCADPSHRMRFGLVCNVYEGIDDTMPMVILDVYEGEYMTLSELLDWLPEDLRKRILHS